MSNSVKVSIFEGIGNTLNGKNTNYYTIQISLESYMQQLEQKFKTNFINWLKQEAYKKSNKKIPMEKIGPRTLTKITGIKMGNYQNYLYEEVIPNKETLNKLTKIFNTNAQTLFDNWGIEVDIDTFYFIMKFYENWKRNK